MSMSNQVVQYLSNVQTVDANTIKVLKETLYPGAKDESIDMVLSYCKARKLDPLKKPVHLVPMSVKTGRKDGQGKDVYEYRDVVMPGIGLYRIEADRSGQYAGMSEPEFGPDVTEKVGSITITYPKWCKITVYKNVGDKIVGFTAMEFWKENYATKGRADSSPNSMWEKRAYGQLAKCAEAQALRKAFPDVVGNEPTKEEMEGKSFNHEVINQKIESKTIIDVSPSLSNEFNVDDMLLQISQCVTSEVLQEVYTACYKELVKKQDKEGLKRLIEAKDKKKSEINMKSFNTEIDEATGEVKNETV